MSYKAMKNMEETYKHVNNWKSQYEKPTYCMIPRKKQTMKTV